MNQPLIKRVVLRNYRSIKSCKVEMSALTVIVGRNAAGKSNFVDAIRFVRDALVNQLDFAMRERGGIDEVRRRAAKSRPPNFSIELELTLKDGWSKYGFTIAPVEGRQFAVAKERCIVHTKAHGGAAFEAERGRVIGFSQGDEASLLFKESAESPIAAAPDRLYLVSVSNLPQFRPVYEALTRMVFHNLNPDEMKKPQRPERGDQLSHDGRNIASVIKELTENGSSGKSRVIEYLKAIGVGISEFRTHHVQGYETVEFTQAAPNLDRPWKFNASAMSDGTMRSLGILISLLATRGTGNGGPTLVAVEEPETALHPAAAGALFDAITEASLQTQVLVTCHSPDLLDQPGLLPESIIAAVLDEQGTRLGRLSEAKRELLRTHLQTAGELLRLDQLIPDPQALALEEDAPTLFEGAS